MQRLTRVAAQLLAAGDVVSGVRSCDQPFGSRHDAWPGQLTAAALIVVLKN